MTYPQCLKLTSLMTLSLSLSMLSGCLTEENEVISRTSDLGVDQAQLETDQRPPVGDAEASDPDAEPPPLDMSEFTPDQERPDIALDMELPDLDRMPADMMPADMMPADMMPADMMPADMMPADMMPAPEEVEWAQCAELCLTEDPERLDGCSPTCEPIAPEVCQQACSAPHTERAWSNIEYIDLLGPYTALHISDSGLVVRRLVEGSHIFEVRGWDGTIFRSLTLPPMPYGEIEVQVSQEAVLIYHEWDNTVGGELFLYSWEGVELAREEVVYVNYICRRPALFRDRVIYSALGPIYECFDTPFNIDRAVYASHLIRVRVFTGFEYDFVIDDDEPYHRINAEYYLYDEESPRPSFLIGDTHNVEIKAVSDVGFVYHTENLTPHLALPPVSPEALWTYQSLLDLIPSIPSAFQFKNGSYEGLYGVHDTDASHDLYRFIFNGDTPQRFELVRRFVEPVSKLTDRHMITREEAEGIWVRHRLPACTADGRCACLNNSALPDCGEEEP